MLPAADLALTKSDGVALGDRRNLDDLHDHVDATTGPSTVIAGVVVSDPIPAGTNGSESEADCAIAAGTFTCTTSVDLAPAELGLLPAHARRASELRAGEPVQHGVDHRPRRSRRPTPRTTRPPTRIPSSSRVTSPSRRRTASASVVAGTSTTYTITATNSGPSQIPAGVVLSDPIPAGTVGSESRARLRDRRRHVHVHDVGSDRRRRFGLVPADARRRARTTRRRRSSTRPR